MSFLIIFLVIVAALFALAYSTKRRFGIAGLALAAGAMLSELWVGSLTPIIAGAGVTMTQPPLEGVVAAGLILLPGILLLFTGAAHKGKVQRVVGAVAFAVLAAVLLLPVFGSALVIDDTARPVFSFFTQYRPVIITAALMCAIGDLLAVKMPKHRGREH